jgi:uncharacterized protein YebE (UPF0316 family)
MNDNREYLDALLSFLVVLIFIIGMMIVISELFIHIHGVSDYFFNKG